MNSAQLMEHFDILVGLDNNPILDKYFYLTSPHREWSSSYPGKPGSGPHIRQKKPLPISFGKGCQFGQHQGNIITVYLSYD